jgi:hypothetical protein
MLEHCTPSPTIKIKCAVTDTNTDKSITYTSPNEIHDLSCFKNHALRASVPFRMLGLPWDLQF